MSPPQGFSSNAEFVKSRAHAPTTKPLNTNVAALYDRIREAEAVTSGVQDAVGKAPRSFEKFARDYAAMFS